MKKATVSAVGCGAPIKIVFMPVTGIDRLTINMQKDAETIAHAFYHYLPSGTVDRLLEEIKRYRGQK